MTPTHTKRRGLDIGARAPLAVLTVVLVVDLLNANLWPTTLVAFLLGINVAIAGHQKGWW